MNAPLIQSPEEDPFKEKLQTFWGQVGEDLVRKSIEAIDETARQIIGVAGVLEGLYFHAIAYSDLRGQIQPGWPKIIYLAPVVLFLLSLTFALLVFFPDRYRLDLRAPQAAQETHSQVVRKKYYFMRIASICLILGVSALFSAIFLYLQG